MGNSQLPGAMGEQDLTMARVKAIMEEIQYAEAQNFTTHGLHKTLPENDLSPGSPHDEPTQPTEDSKDQLPELEDIPQTTQPTEDSKDQLPELENTPQTSQKTEHDLFAEVFHKEYPTSTFKVVTEQDNGNVRTEIALSDVDWFKVLSQQVGILDAKIHKLLTVRITIQAKTNVAANKLVSLPSNPTN